MGDLQAALVTMLTLGVMVAFLTVVTISIWRIPSHSDTFDVSGAIHNDGDQIPSERTRVVTF